MGFRLGCLPTRENHLIKWGKPGALQSYPKGVTTQQETKKAFKFNLEKGCSKDVNPVVIGINFNNGYSAM